MIFVEFKAEHLTMMKIQKAQEIWKDKLLTYEYSKALEIPGMAWTALKNDEVLGCAGMIPVWEGRVIAWALFGDIPKHSWILIFRKIQKEFRDALANHGRHRIETTTPVDFVPGHRLAKMLGFEIEGLMKEYGPDGKDHLMLGKILECV